MTALSPSRELLVSCCGSPVWADLVALAGPYDGLDELVATGRRAWWSLDADDIRAALAAHPRIGDHPPAGSQEAREQAAAQGADPAVLDAIAGGNIAYEARFGFTYVVRAAGRSAQEMLDLLRDRLANQPGDELRTAAAQQWEITELRLRAAYQDDGGGVP